MAPKRAYYDKQGGRGSSKRRVLPWEHELNKGRKIILCSCDQGRESQAGKELMSLLTEVGAFSATIRFTRSVFTAVVVFQYADSLLPEAQSSSPQSCAGDSARWSQAPGKVAALPRGSRRGGPVARWRCRRWISPGRHRSPASSASKVSSHRLQQLSSNGRQRGLGRTRVILLLTWER